MRESINRENVKSHKNKTALASATRAVIKINNISDHKSAE